MTSNHNILGVSESATPEQIRKAYKRLAMKHHPDREGGDLETFQTLQKAYEAIQTRVCPICNGKGKVEHRNGPFVKKVNCPRCWSAWT